MADDIEVFYYQTSRCKYFKNKDNYFCGICIHYHFNNQATVYRVENYKDGVLHGHIFHFVDGHLMVENYDEGQQHGLNISVFHKYSGTLYRYVRIYDHDVRLKYRGPFLIGNS